MDDLQRELGRLETKLAGATPDSRVIDELATMRGELSRPGDDGPFQLANLRLATPCKERWADMDGDARVRVCNGCDRPVFNLSEMTRDQAEAVLATRGIKPCVRFYRRADGTVMTADCPTGARRSRKLTVITAGALLGASSAAMADPAPDTTPAADETPATDETPTQVQGVTPTTDENLLASVFSEDQMEMGVMIETRPLVRPRVEWSIWTRLGYGIASRPSTLVARATSPLMPESSGLGEGALGLDITYGLANRGAIRVGAWAELRTVSGPVTGGELIVGGIPSHPYRNGSMGIVLRGGGNGRVVTGALGFGYAGADPNLGFGHATGLRVVTSMTHSVQDAHDWSVTLGIELDPIGAIGFLVHRR